jgi:hypothetical protein
MQLWQMDVMGGVLLEDGTELKVLTGLDDHSRFCIAAGLLTKATSRAVCAVLVASLRRKRAWPFEVSISSSRPSLW